MSADIRLDVGRVDTFVDLVGRSVHRSEATVVDHETVRRRYLAAPSDLPLGHPDTVGPVRADLERLRLLVAATAGLADRLRGLDAAALAALDADVEARWHAEFVDGLDEERHEWLRERVGEVLTWEGRIAWLDELADGVADRLETSVLRVRTTLRRTTIVLEEVLDDAVRRTLVELRELEHLLEFRPAVDAAWLRRVGSAADWLGPAGDVVAGAFAGWEQWDEDQHRDDLTSTERALRAGLDANLRGGAQAVVGMGTTAAAAPFVLAAPVTGGASLVVAGAVLVAGVAVGEVVDAGLDGVLGRAYEADGFETSADWLDDRGRDLRDAAVATGAWASEQLEDLRDLAGVAGRAWDGGRELGQGAVADLRDGAGDLAGALGGLTGALPWP